MVITDVFDTSNLGSIPSSLTNKLIHGVRAGHWFARAVCETGVSKGTYEFDSRLTH